MKKFIIITMICTISIFMLFGCVSKGYTTISAQEGKEMIEQGDIIILDVREQSEYNAGHIENAILLPLGQIESKAEEIIADKEATIIVYCRSGRRSAEAANKLVKLGYKNIYDMGGIIEWQNEGYAVMN